jgi:hypothetical protein
VSLLRGLALREVAASLDKRFDGPTLEVDRLADLRADARALAAWCKRRLAVHDVVSCSLDAISLQLRAGRGAGRGVLVASMITLEGCKVLLGLQLGSRESDQRGQPTSPTSRRRPRRRSQPRIPSKRSYADRFHPDNGKPPYATGILEHAVDCTGSQWGLIALRRSSELGRSSESSEPACGAATIAD